ncbi:MAG: hypothetical protein ACM3KM_04020 [Acidobacteriaceae bacterium]
MPERGEDPIIPPQEGSQVTPEEQKRIEDSGAEFEAKKETAQASRQRKRQPEGRPAKIKMDQNKIAGMGDKEQKSRIRSRIAKMEEPVKTEPSDFAQSFEVKNDPVAIGLGKTEKFIDKFKRWIKGS